MAGRASKKSVFEKFMDLDTSDDEQRQDDAELKDKQKQKKKARSKKKNRCEAARQFVARSSRRFE